MKDTLEAQALTSDMLGRVGAPSSTLT